LTRVEGLGTRGWEEAASGKKGGDVEERLFSRSGLLAARRGRETMAEVRLE
jgi:hypothetical protein